MSAKYAKIAERYWTTYLPSRVRETKDPDALFESLGEQVETMILTGLPRAEEAVKKENPDATYPQMAGLLRGVRGTLEAAALRDVVYLTPERGTEDKRMPGTTLPGWE